MAALAYGRAAQVAYDNAHEDDARVADDAMAKRADADWHRADLHDAMYGNWTTGSTAHWFKPRATDIPVRGSDDAYWGIES